MADHSVKPAARVRASAPVRLDFAGGWTDVAPYWTESRGLVVNAAIEIRAEVELTLGGSGYRLRSDDLGRTLEVPDMGGLEKRGDLDLLRAAIRMNALGPCALRTWSAAPAGSGLGSSGALDVALVAALARATARTLTPVEMAEEAWQLEAVEAALPGGRQDQYAAALGGFHRLDFDHGAVKVRPLRVEPAFAAELERRILVCYTGQSRVSSNTIARVMSAYVRREAGVAAALDRMVAVAERMTEALEAADLALVGRLLSDNWTAQQALDREMRTGLMASLELAMAGCGSLGGKAAGAGAGGSMFFVIGGDVDQARTAATALGARLVPFRWATQGVRVW
jgi:D-glycero-alpha-D-manno-heptose-7-phosphate kinase